MPRERLDEIGKKIKREADVIASSSAPQAVSVASGRSSRPWQGPINTITPCAACKLLRRRCAQECPFSPYFSPHEPQKFASVHKVFGASNVSKMLMEVPESQRADVANSLVYEANVRLRDPVYGCMGAILALQQQVQVLLAELNAIRSEILKHKYRGTSNNDNTDGIIPSDHNNTHSAGAVSIATPPLQAPPIPLPFLPPSLPPLSSSLQLQPLPSTAATSAASSLYAQSNASTSASSHDYTNICNNDVSYFG